MALVKCPLCGDGSAHVRGCLAAELLARPITGTDAQRQAALQQALFEGEQFLGGVVPGADPFVTGVRARLLSLGLQSRGVRPDDFVAVEHKRAVAEVLSRLDEAWQRAQQTPDGPGAEALVRALRALEGLRVESARLAQIKAAPLPAEEKRMRSNILQRDIALALLLLLLPSALVMVIFRDFELRLGVVGATLFFVLVIYLALNHVARRAWESRQASVDAERRRAELRTALEELVAAPEGQTMVALFDRHAELRTGR